jgi:hypothetical protein
MSEKKPTTKSDPKPAKKKSEIMISCTVLKTGAQIGNSICAKGAKISRPADEVKELVALGLVSAG